MNKYITSVSILSVLSLMISPAWAVQNSFEGIDITGSGGIDMGTYKITDLGAPTAGGDAANKTYVDSEVAGGGKWDTATGGINYSGGNVGIGTTAPGQKLDVVGNAEINGEIRGTTKISFDQGTNFAIDTNGSGLVFHGGDATADFLVYDERAYTDNLTMGYNGTATLATYNTNENLVIDPQGSGITDVRGVITGDTAPSAANHLTRKDYVDGLVSGGVGAIDDLSDAAHSDNSLYMGSGAGNIGTETVNRGNVGIGLNALNVPTTGYHSVAVGHSALGGNTTGYRNTALGFYAMRTNTTGIYNEAIGGYALEQNTGSYNTGLGSTVLRYNTGQRNIAIGYNAMAANTSGSYNNAIGMYALDSNLTGAGNVAIGYNAMTANTSGSHNVAVGRHALDANTTALYNNAVGYGALTANTTGHSNNAMGYNALSANVSGVGNNAIGQQALRVTTGSHNQAIGYQAMHKNTSGSSNVAIGQSALYDNVTHSGNTAVGHNSLANTIQNYNTGVGYQAGIANTTGYMNTALGGYRPLYTNQTGSYNVAVGPYALYRSTHTGNVAMGYAAGQYINSGQYNTTLGYAAGDAITTGGNNVAIGYAAAVPSPTESNQISINNLIYGRNARVGIGKTNPADKFDVDGTIATDEYIKIKSWQGTYGSGQGHIWYDGVGGSGSATGFLGLGTIANNQLVIANSGNVGIGTTTPAAKLEVSGGAIKATGGLIIETRTSDPGGAVNGQMWLRTDL